MKKIAFIIVALITSLSASAQFEAGKTYLGASLTNINLKYNGVNNLQLGLNAQAGLFTSRDLLVYGQIGFDHTGEPTYNDFRIGAGARYYMEQNGIFFGVNANYVQATGDYNDFKPAIEVGYAFFISGEVTIEPALYYEQSFKNHSQYSTLGLKIGLGIYLRKDKIKNSVKEVMNF